MVSDPQLKLQDAQGNDLVLIGKSDTGDDVVIQDVDTGEEIVLGSGGIEVLRARIDNATALQARNNADTGWVDLLQLNASDQVELLTRLAQLRMANATAVEARNNADNAWVNLLQLNASDQLELLTRLAQIRLANDTFLEGRNNADGAWQNLIKINTGDLLEHGINWDSLTAKGQSFVEATRESSSTGNSSGAWVNALDTQQTDAQSEFDENSNARFNPDVAGWYRFDFGVRFFSVTDQDTLNLRIRDVDGGSTVSTKNPSTSASGTADNINGTIKANLSANTNYEVQATDATNGFSVGTGTYCQIEPCIVQP